MDDMTSVSSRPPGVDTNALGSSTSSGGNNYSPINSYSPNSMGGWQTGGLEPRPGNFQQGGYQQNYPFWNGNPEQYPPYSQPQQPGGGGVYSPIGMGGPGLAPNNPMPLMPGEQPTYPPGPITGGLEPNPNNPMPLMPGETPTYPAAPIDNPMPLMPGENPVYPAPSGGIAGPGTQVDGGTWYTPPPAGTGGLDSNPMNSTGGISANSINMNGPQTSSTQAVMLARALGLM